jgi:hypothetical protein
MATLNVPEPARTNALYERAPMPVVDEHTFAKVRAAVENAFAASNVTAFLKSLQRDNLRIREFETVLEAGKLGQQTAVDYSQLAHGDQGQIRELYLAQLEQVELPLRDKFFKLYAYY